MARTISQTINLQSSDSVSKYITEVTANNGIRIHPQNTENHSIIINSNGIELFKDGTTSANSIAFYGDTTRIGKTTGGYTTIASTGMKIYGYNGGLELANIGYGSGNAQVGTDDAPYYTFGLRKSSGTIGNYSIAEGRMVIASGACSHAEGGTTQATAYASHAEGASTIASGPNAHAEGSVTTASGYHSHAEGQNTTASSSDSHAEGQSTTASGNASHAEGHSTIASGAYSHASGYHTTAIGNHQTVIGKYNISNTSDIFIIGNGSATVASNAFTVSSSGNITMYLDSSTDSGVDYRIRTNLTSLGWNDCIV